MTNTLFLCVFITESTFLQDVLVILKRKLQHVFQFYGIISQMLYRYVYSHYVVNLLLFNLYFLFFFFSSLPEDISSQLSITQIIAR